MQMRHDERNPEDGTRVFEPPQDRNGKGFLMVIITPLMLEWFRNYSSRRVTLADPFHTTRYSLELATLMVPNEKDRGLPGDEAACFYNGFRAAFPESTTRLHYCRFHILQA
ncbi:unnamed protein product [Heligmosomoides polygyrus]|uniref:MULE domain-containing protein n=1 Tax=Heligmosomoides polygyrus TaxID=6339 RepID=A0A183GWG3_HELPZ|nr:unnamed protein product [Heligmosomoides polygyrus]